MKYKSLIAISLFASIFTLVGCEKGYYDESGVYHEQNNSYQLEVDYQGHESLCKNGPSSNKYLEGTKFSFRIAIVTDSEFHPYLNGERLSPVNGKDDYKHYEFRMPSKDSTLVIDDNYLTGKDYSLIEILPELNRIKQEDIQGVEVKVGPLRLLEETSSRYQTKYSENPIDIKNNYDLLFFKQLRKTNELSLDSAPQYKVTFKISKTESIEYWFENNVVRTREFNTHYFAFNEDAVLPKILYPSNI